MKRTDLPSLFNVGAEFEFDGAKYKLREMTLLECATYQRWLEVRAREAAGRATDLPEEQQRRLLADVIADIAAGRYAYGSENFTASLTSQAGLTKYFELVLCVDSALAERIVLHGIAQYKAALDVMRANDPKALRQLCTTLGLPPNFLQHGSANAGRSKRSKTSRSRKRR